MVLFLQIFSPLRVENKALAASATVVYRGTVSYGGSWVGDFQVNGEQAFCIEHSKPTPPTNTPNKGTSVYNNNKIAATLYWGWGGDKNIFGSDRERGIVVTSLVLSRIYTGEDAGGKSITGYSQLYEKALSEDIPNASVNFLKSNVNSSVIGNVQKTDTNKFIADSSNEVSFNLPSEITLHNVTTGKSKTGGFVTLSGGNTFYLTAPLTYDKDFDAGNLKGIMKEFAPIVVVMQNPELQTLSFGVFRDPLDTANFTANFEVRQKKVDVHHRDAFNNTLLVSESYIKNIGSSYSYNPKSKITYGGNSYIPTSTAGKSGTVGTSDITLTFLYNLQRNITVLHKDARDGTLLASKKEVKTRGTEYSYSPRTDLKKGEYTYRPVSTATKTGTVGSNNITLTFLYDVPLIKTGLKKVQIYTAPADSQLPVKIQLDKTDIYDDSVTDMAKAKVNVNLYKGTKLIKTNSYTAKSLPTSISMVVPSTQLAVNTKSSYSVKVEGFNANQMDIPSDERSLTTDGYTSSERTLTVNAKSKTKLDYKGVIMTEREVRKSMVLFNETLSLSFKKQPKKRTGYGFDAPIDVIYTNDLGGSFNTGYNLKLPSKLVDSYVTYPVKNGLATTSMDQVKTNTSVSGQKRTTTNKYELPHVNVERETGYLFSDQQVAAKDQRIKKALRDGGRKFYTPIWGDLGTYLLTFSSTKPIGVHKVNVVIKDNVEVFAFMYGHMNSPTTKQDGIFLSPVNPSAPLFPDSWTQEDIAAFKEWNKKVNK